MSCDPNAVISSQALSDLNKDIKTIDEVVESSLDTTTTKDGKVINTLEGQLKLLGYEPPVVYAAAIGFTSNDNTKTIDRNGTIYAPLPSAIPFTTSGTWTADDENKFFVVQGLTTGSSEIVLAADTVADMKTKDLKPGQFIRTKGYHTNGGAGSAKYLIQTAAEFSSTPDGFGDHLLDNGNVASLKSDGDINLKQYGAYGDGSTDDTAAIQAAIIRAQALSTELFAPTPSVHYSVRTTIGLGSSLLQIRGNKSLFKWDGVANDEMFSVSGVGGQIEATSINLNGNNVARVGLSLGVPTGTAFASFGSWTRDCFITGFTDYGIDPGISNDAGAAVDMKFYNTRLKGNGTGCSIPQPSYTFYGGQIDDNTNNGLFVGGNGFFKAFGLIFNNNGDGMLKFANLSRGGSLDGCWFEGSNTVRFVNAGPLSNNIGSLAFRDCHFKVNAGQEWLNFTDLNEGKVIVDGGQISISSTSATLTVGGNKTVVTNIDDASGLLTFAGNLQFLTLINNDDITIAKNGKLEIRKQDGTSAEVMQLGSVDDLNISAPTTLDVSARGVDAVQIDADNGRGGLILRNDAGTINASTNPPANAAKLIAQDNGAGKTLLIVRFDDGSQAVISTQP